MWWRFSSSEVDHLNTLPTSLLQDILDAPLPERTQRYWLTQLILQGVSLDTKYDGLTLLHRAVLQNRRDHLEWILELNPNTGIKSSTATGSRSAMEMAFALRRPELAELIQEYDRRRARVLPWDNEEIPSPLTYPGALG